MANWERWRGIMKAYPFEEKRLAKWKPPYIVQPKYDGIRCRAIPVFTNNSIEYLLVSSEENPIFSVPHLNKLFGKLNLSGMELDGELYCHGMSFEQIVSITSRTVNLHEDYERIQFHCFDIVDETLQQGERLSRIIKLKNLSPWLQIAPFYICENLSEVIAVYNMLIDASYEGIIVRNLYTPYEKRRSNQIMKFKPKKEDTYQILSMIEETSEDNRLKNSLGSLVCLSGEDGYVDILNAESIEIDYNKMIAVIDYKVYDIFCVGTGFTYEQRTMLWKDPSIIGRSVKVKYQHLTSEKRVPRFPVFVELVEDKQ